MRRLVSAFCLVVVITLLGTSIRLLNIHAFAETFTPIPEDTLIDLLCYLARDVPSVYDSARGYPYNVMYWDGTSWHTDCNNLYKVIFSGWNKTLNGWNIRNPTRVGAYYSESFVTGDVSPRGLINACENQTRNYDFTTLGNRFECLFMPGNTYDHFGGYLGKEIHYNGNTYNVVECTIAWEQGILFSYVDSDGTRRKYKGGSPNGKWERHAYAPSSWVNYNTNADTSTLSYENTTYTVTNNFNLKRQPYNDSEVMGTYGVGDTLSIKRVVLNDYNNVWVQINTGGYVYAGYKYENGTFTQTGTQYLRLKADNPVITINDPNMPNDTLAQGAGFEIKGTIDSSNSLQSVVAEVYNGSTLVAASNTWNSGNKITKRLNLFTSVVNTTLKFGSLPEGNYTFKLNATYYYDRGTKTATKTIYTSSFSIENGGAIPPTPVIDSWTYRVVTSDGLNMRSYASTAASLVTTLFSPTTITVTQKTSANGYTWGYGTSSTGYTGWIVVDNDWTTLVSSTVDSTAPAITGVQVYDVTSSGYTVSCNVSDNVGVTRVVFPTWTTNNGQDDLFSDWGNTALGTISNGTATYRVNTSQHNNETGCTYITHIYAYDAAGNTGHVNQSDYSDLQVQVPTPTISTTGIQLDRSSVDVDLGSSGDKSFNLVATIYPSNATNKTVHWSSSNQSVAWVDNNGLVTPTTVGSTVITAMAENGGYQATCTVNVSTWINGISLNTTEATLNMADNETLQLTKTITPNTATNKNVVWNSTDASVATVSPNGLVTPVGTGIAIITCTAQDPSGFFALCAVTVVNNIDVESIELNQSRIVFDHSDDSVSRLNACFTPENATRTNLTWMSSNESVATVSNGLVQSQHKGYARIICTAESGATAICDVIVHAEDIIILPSSLRTIEAEAFYGSSISEVVIPGRTTTIGSKAFANCNELRLIIIPKSVTSIASDAFSGSEDVVFICEAGSTAAEYAAGKGITAVLSSMPESVVIYADTTTVVQGKCLWLGAEVIPSGVTQRVTWSIIEGKNIASIDQTGMLTTHGPGSVTVAATAINGATGIINITVLDKPATYAVMFDPNGGTCDTSYLNARFDEALGTLPVPVRDYYTFNGWYTSASGGTRVTSDTVYDDYDMGDITLYAHWTEHEWSDWVTEDQLPTGTIQKESKQQYRYQDKVYSEWSGWGTRTETRESTGELKKERQLTEYYWYYDLCQNCGRHSPYTVCWDCGHSIGANWRVTWLDTSRSEGAQFGNSDKIFTMTDDGRWFYWTDDNGNGDSRTVYQYATRTYSWSNWSEWSDDYVAATATRNVDSRYVYRYKLP